MIAGVIIALGTFGINKAINTIEETAFDKGYSQANAENATAVVKKGKDNEKTQYELRTLDDVDLVDRYCKWVSDVPHSECVKTNLNAK